MQGRRKYTLKEIQAECWGSIGKETMNAKLGAMEGFTEEVVFELGLEE